MGTSGNAKAVVVYERLRLVKPWGVYPDQAEEPPLSYWLTEREAKAYATGYEDGYAIARNRMKNMPETL